MLKGETEAWIWRGRFRIYRHMRCPQHPVNVCGPCSWWSHTTCAFANTRFSETVYSYKIVMAVFGMLYRLKRRSEVKTFENVYYLNNVCGICHCQPVVFVAMVWVIWFPFVIWPAHDWVVPCIACCWRRYISGDLQCLIWVVIFGKERSLSVDNKSCGIVTSIFI